MADADGPVFQPGDTVRLNELSATRGKFRDRSGVIVGASRIKGKFRVLWSGLKRPQIVPASLLQLELADSDRQAIARHEAVLDAVDEALEKTRESRIERHLNMPRERPVETDPHWRTGAPRRRPYVVVGLIGLAAATVVLGAASALIGW